MRRRLPAVGGANGVFERTRMRIAPASIRISG
jgi:hypothetical protein